MKPRPILRSLPVAALVLLLPSFAGCPAITPPQTPGGSIPADPNDVDPPIEVVAHPGDTVTVPVSGVNDGAQLAAYLDGAVIATTTVKNGQVQFTLKKDVATGRHALALVNTTSNRVSLARVLVVSPLTTGELIIPSDPNAIDPPLETVMAEGGFAELSLPDVEAGESLDLYVDGAKVGAAVAGDGSVIVQLPDLTAGTYALALVDDAEQEVLTARVLTVIPAGENPDRPPIDTGGGVPADPNDVDPPIQVTGQADNTATVPAPSVSKNARYNVYIDGVFVGSMAGGGRSLKVPLPTDLDAGEHALALVDSLTGRVRYAAVLTVN